MASRLLFTDTDSMVYRIETLNVYGDFSKSKEIFGFRSYSPNAKYCDDLNVLVVYKMKG